MLASIFLMVLRQYGTALLNIGALHTATSGNPDTATPDGKFDTGIVGANQQSKPVTMPTQPGDYIYFCTLHPFLVGTVTVQ
jgi:plastocyanin